MNQKRRVLFALVIAVVIVVAVFVSFAVNLLLRKTPSVRLPDLSPTETTGTPDPTGAPVDENGFLTVDVTPQTVQEVIRTLSRPDSYSRDMTVTLYWDTDRSDRTALKVWQDGGFTRVEATPPTGLVQYNLIHDSSLYRWYAGSGNYATLPLEPSSADLVQRIPTYEDVLALEPGDITAAGYEVRHDMPCIYVAVAPDGGYQTTYWISIQSGLLVGAETVQDGQTTYLMEADTPPETPCPADASFTLPDGTVLHTVSR